jgi:hypothetical protein
MSTIPTESRIFADRFFRELRRLEALHAGRIAPGTKTWQDALLALHDRMGRAGSPSRQAAVLGGAITYLDGIEYDERTYIRFAAYSRSRAAGLALATFNADKHPLVGVHEQGINILAHVIYCERSGVTSLISDVNLAYVSRHAFGRMHEREPNIAHAINVRSVLVYVGVLGYLTRASEKHVAGELCLAAGDVLVVGSLKHSLKPMDGGPLNGTFYDVRTALPAEEVHNLEMLEQGRIASQVVTSWFTDPPDDDSKLADQIPFLPRRPDDYTMRAAVGGIENGR